jgi:hypothetical protein
LTRFSAATPAFGSAAEQQLDWAAGAGQRREIERVAVERTV